MLIHQLTLRDLLSFGRETTLTLRPLNVLIGPNGSGKSNLLEVIGLLRAAPTNLSAPVRKDGIREWLWKGSDNAIAGIEAVIQHPEEKERAICHCILFAEHGHRFELKEETIDFRDIANSDTERSLYYLMSQGSVQIVEPHNRPADVQSLDRSKINPDESILSQLKHPSNYPFLTQLTKAYSGIHLYREWIFGRYGAPRQPQKPDLPTKYLLESCENLALVLNAIRPTAKRQLIDALTTLYPEIEDFNVQVVGGGLQLFLEEGRFTIPATRLSDGTLRYLCLLAILCHPDPPPLVCIEEPELGLHPDVLSNLAKLMIEASTRCQLIVTTHSDILVDALSETPESVVVCEKHEGVTQMRRLDRDPLGEWLERYRLGQLWLRGELGGTRW